MLLSKTLRPLALAAALAVPHALYAANHREAPITAIDRTADITDWYTFVSYDNPGRVTLILAVDPLLEPVQRARPTSRSTPGSSTPSTSTTTTTARPTT